MEYQGTTDSLTSDTDSPMPVECALPIGNSILNERADHGD